MNASFFKLVDSADLGCTEAMYELATLYEDGKTPSCMKEPVTAFRYYMKAAKLGHIESIHNIANCYSVGYGVEQDFNEAISWYMIAAEKGSADAMNNISCMYKRGLGVEKSQELADMWASKADALTDIP